MLREAWKRDSLTLEEFIKEHYARLPRTSLRYAIERMEPVQRKSYLREAFKKLYFIIYDVTYYNRVRRRTHKLYIYDPSCIYF